MDGMVRVAAAVPRVGVGAIDENRRHTLALWEQADAAGCALVVAPELGLTAYTLRDLFLDRHLLDRAAAALLGLAADGAHLRPLLLVGLPLQVGGGLYNVAAAVQGGRVLGLVPKAYLPNYREFEEARWFRPGRAVPPGATARLHGADIPFGTDLLFVADDQPDLIVGVEICEDYWVHVPPHVFAVSAGATVIANLSASNFTVGKSELRRLLARAASDRGKCAYVYVAAGPGESSTDLAFDADAFISENGGELAASRRFDRADQLVVADVDLEGLQHERMATGTFGDCAEAHARPFRRIAFRAGPAPQGLRRAVAPHPFIPKDPATLATRCWEVFEIQTNALATRVAAIGRPRLVLGLSGGLDSTQAALVCAQALDLLGRPRSDLLCLTMPGFGTTGGTRDNAGRLAAALGAELREVGVAELSRAVLADIGHPAGADTVEGLLDALRAHPQWGDITLENVQARLRTLLLMSVANQTGGLVVGTGDLSEKALGWCTYSGDHISMYDVNAGVPKTLMQFVVRWVAAERCSTWVNGDPSALAQTLADILDTPISPELLPANADGQIAQLTEGAIGPYELHDFFLHQVVRLGRRPAGVVDLAHHAFAGRYDRPTIKGWLRVFYRRFFSAQFKRSCATDGPKVGTVALSPRGDWRMPSDAQVGIWLAALDALVD